MAEYIELTTVGEMLKEEFIEPFNLTQNALANAIFVPPNRIHQIISQCNFCAAKQNTSDY